jgi:hypothetical protein
MMVSLAPPLSFSISATKCGVLPVPAVEKLRPPPLLDVVTRSFRLLIGESAATTMTEGLTAISTIGTSSSSLYGIVFLIIALVMTPPAGARKV